MSYTNLAKAAFYEKSYITSKVESLLPGNENDAYSLSMPLFTSHTFSSSNVMAFNKTIVEPQFSVQAAE